VNDQIRDIHRKNVFSVDRFGIKPWFDLTTGRRFLQTTPGHPSMFSA
jgi:hypothetical protein